MITPRSKTIPGPRSIIPLKASLAFRNQPLQFLGNLQKQYGDIAQFRLAIWPTVFLGHPDYINYVLQENHTNYDKDVLIFQVLKPVVGNGLTTVVGGDDWLRQRRLVQPAFHRQRIAALGTLITDATTNMLQQWNTYANERQVFDVAEEMTSLTLQIVSKSLFGVDISAKTNSFRQALSFVSAFISDYFYMPFPPLSAPMPRHRRFWAAIETMDNVVYELIRMRRWQNVDVGDWLSMMVNAVDEDRQVMDDKHLRDEIMTMLLESYETSASALAWTWYLLTQHPEAQECLHAELDRVLAGRCPTVEDLPQLPYTRMVIEEAMRLYPPAWMLMRRAVQNDEIDGYHIPASSYILWSPYISHRHPDFWERPAEFYPEHFAPKLSAKRPLYAFMPFGNGPRICLGRNFAMMEMQLILATLAQQYKVSLAPEHHVDLEPRFSLRPKSGVPVYLEHRYKCLFERYLSKTTMERGRVSLGAW